MVSLPQVVSDDPAVIDAASGATISHRGLRDRVVEQAERLHAQAADGLALLACRNDTDTVVRYLGCRAAGVPVLMVDGRSVAVPAAQLLDAYQPDVLLGVETPVPGYAGTGAELRRERPGEPVHCSDAAVLLPTSGSTGSPKFVRLSNANLDANAASIAEALSLTVTERGLANLPLHYSYGLSVLNSHLADGAAVVLTGSSAVTPGFWQELDRHGVTSIPGVPYSYDLFRRVGLASKVPSTLRSMTQAGGHLADDSIAELWELLTGSGRSLFIMYGQTEATARMAVLDPRDLPEALGSVGQAIPGGSFSIDGPDQDGTGEVIYRGPNVMLGYAADRAEVTDRDDLGGVLRTGDLGRLDQAGRLWLTGRLKRITKLFGERVSLDDVEDLCGDLKVAAVESGGRLVIVVEGHAPEGLARTVERALAVPPRTITVRSVDELPRTSTGKVDYGVLSAG